MGEPLGERVQRLSSLLREAERPVRVLRTIVWRPEVRERFFAASARELPVVEYERPDAAPVLESTGRVLAEATGNNVIDGWLRRSAESIATAARMLEAAGTPDFHRLSRELYGDPHSPLTDGMSTSLELAEQLDRTLDMDWSALGGPAPACREADSVAESLRAAVERIFGAEGPSVSVEDDLSANVVAGPRQVRVRRRAAFTDRDVDQLIAHELRIHVATWLNGASQRAVPLLACAHAGTTRTQEGLAVFSELISGSMEPERFLRLSDRVLAIKQAMDGASFLDVYRWFVEETDDEEQAFESTRRVFRGGTLEGGAPFTKDVVYLDGLLRVHNFLQAAVVGGRSDCLRLLFAGKLDIEDLPSLCELRALDLVGEPVYLPPWLNDQRFLTAYLAYSSFLNRVDLSKVRAHYDDLLAASLKVPR